MTDHAHELRRHARKIAHPAGDVPAVMLAAADEIERLRTESAGLIDDMNLLRDNNTALRARIAAMEQQETVAQVGVHKTGGNAGIAWSARPLNEFDSLPPLCDGDKLYLAPGAQPAPSALAEAIIADMQAQHDSELITENDSGEALIRLDGAIAAVEDNFALAQPTPSVPAVDALAQFIREIDGAHQLGAGVLAEHIVAWLAAAPEAKP